MPEPMQFILCSLACWRICHLLAKEDGPWDIVFRFRKQLGQGVLGSLFDCFYCLSVWIAFPFGLWLASGWTNKLVCWLAISGAACLLEQFTTSQKNNNNPPDYTED